MLQAFRNGKLLTGAGIELDRTLLVRDGRIESVIGAREVVGADRVIDLGGDLLVPGFIDAQVNGGGGALFNADPSAATIAPLSVHSLGLGTRTVMPFFTARSTARARSRELAATPPPITSVSIPSLRHASMVHGSASSAQ